ncbi:MAG: recombinase family protein [Alphaproteobacteria bacterium]|jgi:site-specific DNA recombinase|nr:recombinase family protein [Alphaproteobacteria bacterium]MBT4017090.1 recombinase family protein [Alphaproteobacteria bacterium]MBT4546060.1 recombinase family protein [Alphaproteobacteria bacterium]MBT7745070.1 recombinase family protein [Alphaproteobacteria bacterium]
MKAVIYARYSSDNQREASIDDQVEVCRRFIGNQHWDLTDTYDDAATSGASKFRPGYQQMLSDAERSLFDVLVCESLDRLGRKLSDIADLHDRLTFRNIKIHAVNVGEITPMHIGLLGTMAQLTLSDLRDKTKRGQLGRVRQGRMAGGKAYGYDVVVGSSDDDRGKRCINTAEAVIVNRIFEDFARGKSPRKIAKVLNEEHVPGPEGRPWGDTTIRGQFERGTGILNNATYVGRIEWNRCSFVKDPATGKRLARPNPPDKWEVVEVPELRIVDDDLWHRVKERQQEVRIEIGRDQDGNALNRAHRQKYIFSGLLKCGECGGSYTIMGKDRYGCATRRSKGTCENRQTITRQAIEQRILSGLAGRLLRPELIDTFVGTYNAEIKVLTSGVENAHKKLKSDLRAVERKITGMMKAIEDGMYSASMKDRMSGLENRKSEIEKELARPTPAPLRIHSDLPKLFADKLGNLVEALNDDAIKTEAGEIIRSLVDRVVLKPGDETCAMRAELYGDLAGILAISEADTSNDQQPALDGTGCQLSVVAGARNQLYLLFSYRYKTPAKCILNNVLR